MLEGGRERDRGGGRRKEKKTHGEAQREQLLSGVSPSLYAASASPTTQPWVCPSKHTNTLHFRVTSIQMASRSDFLKSVQPQSALVDVTAFRSPSSMFFRPKELRSGLSITCGHPLRSENRCTMDSLNHAWLSYAHGSQWLIFRRDPRIQL